MAVVGYKYTEYSIAYTIVAWKVVLSSMRSSQVPRSPFFSSFLISSCFLFFFSPVSVVRTPEFDFSLACDWASKSAQVRGEQWAWKSAETRRRRQGRPGIGFPRVTLCGPIQDPELRFGPLHRPVSNAKKAIGGHRRRKTSFTLLQNSELTGQGTDIASHCICGCVYDSVI